MNMATFRGDAFLVFWILLDCLTIGTESFSFGIVDVEQNGVIFAGDVNIKLRCEVNPDVGQALLEIVHQPYGQVKANNSMTGCIAEYVIHNVTSDDGGHYACLVTHPRSTGGGKFTKAANVYLKIHTKGPQCILNNASHGAFYDGDIFMLSCYCLPQDECVWGSSNTAVNLSLDNQETVYYSNKILVRAIVGPLSLIDNDSVYRCSVGPSDSQQCTIGPLTILNRTSLVSPPKAFSHLTDIDHADPPLADVIDISTTVLNFLNSVTPISPNPEDYSTDRSHSNGYQFSIVSEETTQKLRTYHVTAGSDQSTETTGWQFLVFLVSAGILLLILCIVCMVIIFRQLRPQKDARAAPSNGDVKEGAYEEVDQQPVTETNSGSNKSETHIDIDVTISVGTPSL